MENLINDLEKYLKALNVEQLYNDPGHKNAKNWVAEVGALLKDHRKSAYKGFKNLSQHLYPSIPLNTRKHAAEQMDVFIRQILAEYKRAYITRSDEGDHEATRQIDKIKIFLSYSTDNKEGVGRIKTWLTNFGFEAFLAHEDITPSLEWQNEIIVNLDTCHIFIPIITDEFLKSSWTDQEAGIAFIKKKKIVPVSIGHKPYGFLGIYQGLPMDLKYVENGCIGIVKAIKTDQRYAQIVLDLVISSLSNSRSFASSEWKTSIIAEFDSFTKEQFDMVLKSAIDNNQVSIAFGSRIDLKNLIKKYPHLVDPGLLKQLNKKDEDFKFD